MFKISIIIPVKNGSATLERCLESITSQQEVVIEEIIILDSASSDTSILIAERFGAKIISIKPYTFNHGLTRNVPVQHAAGNLLFYTVQDASLSDRMLLNKMATYFYDDSVMAVCGHQAVPHEKDKNPRLWYHRFTDPIPEFRQWKPGKPMPAYSWDNVVAMYRKSALEQLPFEQTDTTEDWIWAYAALKKEWRIVYDPAIVVWHYHHRTFKYILRSDFSVYYTLFKNFGTLPRRTGWLKRNATDIYHLLNHKELTVNEKIKWIIHNFNANTATSLTAILFKLTKLISKGARFFI